MNVDYNTFRLDVIGMIACLVIAFGLRLAVIANEPEQLTIDRDVYLGIATSIAEGRGYSSPNGSTATAFRPPLYPLSLAGGIYFFQPRTVVAALNLLSGLLTVWLTASLGERLQLGRYRFIAALFVAIDPLLLRYTSQPMTESLNALLATLWLWTVIAESESPTSRYAANGVRSGISFGLLVLCRPTFWLIAGFGGLKLLYSRWRTTNSVPASRSPVNLSPWIWAASGTVLVVAPWLIRNWLVFGVPILTTTHGGYTLLLGNNPVYYDQVVRQPWGTVWQQDSLLNWQADLESQIDRDLGHSASEVERDRWNSRQAKRFMAAHPLQFGAAALHRIRSLWNTIPQGDTANSGNGWLVTAVGWFYAFVLTAGFIGMALVVRYHDAARWLPLYALIACVQLAHLFYWTNTRMRAPLTPAIALFAAATISRKVGVIREN